MRVREASEEPGAGGFVQVRVRRREKRKGKGDVVRVRRAGELTWLVERDVPVLADTAEEELDAAIRLDLFLIRLALLDQVLRVSVQDVHL